MITKKTLFITRELISLINLNFRVFTCQVRPGSLYHESDDAQTFASWVSYYLFDFNVYYNLVS